MKKGGYKFLVSWLLLLTMLLGNCTGTVLAAEGTPEGEIIFEEIQSAEAADQDEQSGKDEDADGEKSGDGIIIGDETGEQDGAGEEKNKTGADSDDINDNYVGDETEDNDTISENSLEEEVLQYDDLELVNYAETAKVQSSSYTQYWENPNYTNLIVFVDFSDTSHDHGTSTTDSYCKSPALTLKYFNGSEDNPRGMRQYLYNISYGQLQVENIMPQYNESTGIVPYQLEQNTAYYYQNEYKLVSDTVAALNSSGQLSSSMSLSLHGKDNVLDNLTIVVPYLTNTGTCSISAHMQEYQGSLTVNGSSSYYVKNYNIVTEQGIYYGLRGSGQIIHEFLHTTGYPDLYCDNDGVPVGTWDIMSADGVKVQYPLAYLRGVESGWFSIPTVTESGQNFTLYAPTTATEATKDQQALILKTDRSDDEFFVVEYRKQPSNTSDGKAYEANIPGSGLIIYRVNRAYVGNHSGKPKWMIYVFRPGDTWDTAKNCENAKGDVYSAYLSADSGRTGYGSSNFADSVAEGAITYSDGTNSGIVISNVGTAGDTISFDISFTEPEEEVWANAAERTDGTNTTAAASCMSSDGTLYYLLKDGNWRDGTVSLYQCGESGFVKKGTAPSGTKHLLTMYNGALYTAYLNSNYYATLAKWNGSSWDTIKTASVTSNEISLASDETGVYVVYSDDSYTAMYAWKYNGSQLTELGTVTNSNGPANPSAAAQNGKLAVVCRESGNRNHLCVKLYDSGKQTWNTIETTDISGSKGTVSIHGQKVYLTRNDTTNKKTYVYVCDLDNTAAGFVQLGEGTCADINVDSICFAFDGDIPYVAYMGNGSPYPVTVKYLRNDQWVSLGETVASAASSDGGLGIYCYEHKLYVTYMSGTSTNMLVKTHTAAADSSNSGESDDGTGDEDDFGDDGDSDEDDIDVGNGSTLEDDIPADGVIPEGLWVAGVNADGYVYTGAVVKPEVRVYDYMTLLQEKTDYTISYKNNIKVNDASNVKTAPTIIVTGRGNYEDKETVTFKILPQDISADTFSADDMTVTAGNKAQKPIPTLYRNGKKLKNKTDYIVAYYQGSDTAGTPLDSVKDAGDYTVVLTGTGNYTGTRSLNLTVTEDKKLISKTTVEKIQNQAYTGSAVTPTITVKDGKTILTESTDGGQTGDYMVTYYNNIAVGTAGIQIEGVGKYTGTKRVTFTISNKAAVNKATVGGLKNLSLTYDGTAKKPSLTLTVNGTKLKAWNSKNSTGDYKVTWKNNRNAGTATVIFTGINGCDGTLKKTFKIKQYDIKNDADKRLTVTMAEENGEVPYVKGGAKPTLTVTFTKGDGTVQILQEGTDYTLFYRNNTEINDGSGAKELPTVIIKGKGNFTGSTELTYKVVAQDIRQTTLTAADKTYQNKKNSYATTVTVTDVDGKALRAGTDYEKNLIYTYENETTLEDAAGTVRQAGAAVKKDDIIPAGTVIRVTATGKGSYTGTAEGTYRITKASVSGASVKIDKQTYTGREITLTKDQIEVKVKGKTLAADQYEIIGYKNNIKKGTASVTIKGLGDYGGTKTVKFTIKAKGFKWWKN